MIRLDDAHWVTYDVEGGAVISATFVVQQKVQWIVGEMNGIDLTGHFN